MINYQLPNALPLGNSGKGMNYPEQHPKREPTMKESQKRYLAVSTDSIGEGSNVAGPIRERHVQAAGERDKAPGSREQY